MKSLSNLLHRTPWAVLLLGGVLVILGLVAFLTPFHLIDYKDDGATAEERRAISREVDSAFADGALELARGAVLTMRSATKDPSTRAELDQALTEIDRAREEMRDAGAKVLEAKREAVDNASEAVKEASTAIREAQRAADEALKSAGLASPAVREALEQSLKAAELAESEAKKALESERAKKRVSIGLSTDKDRPLIDIEVERAGTAPAKPGTPVAPAAPAKPAAAAKPGEPAPPAPPAMPELPVAKEAVVLPPEVRERIRRDVYGDLRKLGVGAGLVLVFLPLFLLAIIAKVFIDRSRAAQRMAELRRKEAEFHRMGQQVTEAKLMALQAQVEPHFLYNTLANVQALTEVDPPQAGVMVGHLIQYLRNALPKMRESISTVGQEIELVRAYLNILQMRMGKRLTFEIAVPASAMAMPFPPLMLPSLVENAIKHGLEPQREGGHVHISAQHSGGRLRLTVADTGRGFGDTVGNGVGLSNLRERLEALYGPDAKLTLEANAPSGVIATIDVPSDGLRTGTPAAASVHASGFASAAPAAPAAPRTRTEKVLSAVGTAERAWRKSLSFAFVALVSVAAVLAGLLLAGVLVGAVPIHMGNETLTGASGAVFGTAGIFLAFAAVVVAIAIVLAVIYGLGFMAVGLLIFVIVVVVVSLLPALAPFILLGLLGWWLYKRHMAQKAEEAARKVEPVMAATAASAAASEPATTPAPADAPPPPAPAPADEPPPPAPGEPLIRRSESGPDAAADTPPPPPLPPEDAPKDGPRGG